MDACPAHTRASTKHFATKMTSGQRPKRKVILNQGTQCSNLLNVQRKTRQQYLPPRIIPTHRDMIQGESKPALGLSKRDSSGISTASRAVTSSTRSTSDSKLDGFPSLGISFASKPSSPQLSIGLNDAKPPCSTTPNCPGAMEPGKRKRRGKKRTRKGNAVVSDASISVISASAASLPSMNLIRQNLSRSNSSFLESYLSQREATRACANATFTYIQRSDTEGLRADLTQIQNLVQEQKEAEKESLHLSTENSTETETEPPHAQLTIQITCDEEVQEPLKRNGPQLVPCKETEKPPQLQVINSFARTSDDGSCVDSSATGSYASDESDAVYETRAKLVCQHLVRLHSYVQDEFYRIVLGNYGAVQVTLEAMNTFSGHEYVQAAGSLTMGGLCDRNLMNSLKLVKSGGLVTIINSIKKFTFSGHVCSMAVNCLSLATAVTELAVLFLQQMKDAVKTLEDIPDTLLSYEAPMNKAIVLGRIKSASLSGKTTSSTTSSKSSS